MNIFEKTMNYIRASRTELESVTWPSREQTMNYTIIVIVISLVFAAFFGILDLGLNSGVEKLLTLRPSVSAPANIPPAAQTNPVETTPGAVDVQTASGTTAQVKVTPVPVK